MLFDLIIFLHADNGGCDIVPEAGRYMRLFWCNCLKSWYVICVLKMNLCFDLISLCETTKTSKKKYKRTYYVACFQVMRLLFYSLIVLYTDNGGCDIEPDVGRYSRLFLVGFLFKRSVSVAIST